MAKIKGTFVYSAESDTHSFPNKESLDDHLAAIERLFAQDMQSFSRMKKIQVEFKAETDKG